jgi:hypothetical protein
VCGIATGLGSRWLSGTHALTLVFGGITMVIAGGVGLGSLGLLVMTGPGGIGGRSVPTLVVDGLFWTSCVAVGLGISALIAGSFDRERIDVALRRYAIATVAFFALAGTGVAVAGGFGTGGTIAMSVGRVLDIVLGVLLATAAPNAAAGPTGLILFVGLQLVRRAVVSVAPPLVFAAQTRDRFEQATARITRAIGWLSIGVLLAGLGLVRAHIVGVLSSPPVTTTALGELVAVTGSAAGRYLALAVCILGSLGLVFRSLFAVWTRGLSEQIVGAALPLVGITAVSSGLVVAVLSLPVTIPQRMIPAQGFGLAGLPPAVVVGLGASVGGTVMAALLIVGMFACWDALPPRAPALAVLVSGLVGLAVVVAASNAAAIIVFALVAVTIVVADVGRVGSSMATEVGRRGGARVELVNGAATVGVGLVAVALATGLTQFRFTATFLPLSYLLGTLGFVTAFVFFGRVLST